MPIRAASTRIFHTLRFYLFFEVPVCETVHAACHAARRRSRLEETQPRGFRLCKEYIDPKRETLLGVRLGGSADEGHIAALERRAKTKAEARQPLRSDAKAGIGDIEVDATVGGTVEQAADGDGGGAARLKIANQKIGGLSGGEDAFAEQNVLAADVDLRGVGDLRGFGVAVAKYMSVWLYELAMDVAGNGAHQVG